VFGLLLRHGSAVSSSLVLALPDSEAWLSPLLGEVEVEEVSVAVDGLTVDDDCV